MERYYKEYIFWEDYLNGMYETSSKENDFFYINKAIELLSNENLFLETCLKVVKHWTISTRVNLTNKNCNRQAWLGQACCSYLYNATETQTRQAWMMLTELQRHKANLIADKIIKNFELNYENKNQKLHL